MPRTENGPVDMAESIQDSNRQTRLRQKPHRYRSNEETTTSHQPLVDTNNNNPWVDPDIDAIARARLEAADSIVLASQEDLEVSSALEHHNKVVINDS